MLPPCHGCQNPQTHDPTGGKAVSVEALLTELDGNPLVDGLSLSGGEPMEQPEGCVLLALAAHRLGLNVWCWTGFLFEDLLTGTAEQRAFLQEVDVLVDGPFLLEQRTLALPWRGSRNQRVIDVKKSLDIGEIVLWEQV
ncbi:anaerobic ribonucleoside-triphosphate reductase activating protein [Oscillibacter valericigenes Sjm18-20]|nr:anaerobic ribonucleoside-triphosphate reductase activating protein [Oscillibacter valericigenes Sjm18-20]